MYDKYPWQNKLQDRLSLAEVTSFARELHHDEAHISSLCEILCTSEDKRSAYNAAWILFYLSKEDKEIYLLPFYDRIADLAMSPTLRIRRGLILSLLVTMPETDRFRTDLFDFCLTKMTDRKESDSSRSVMIKLAARMCRPFPELRNELTTCLELLSGEMKPSLSAACRNALKEIAGKRKANRTDRVVTRPVPVDCMSADNPSKVIKPQESSYTVRPLEEKDAPEMQELFQSTVLNVNLRDYTQEEVADWASCGNSLAHWVKLLNEHRFTGVFNDKGSLVGFSSMNSTGYLHSMFVHKDWQGRGIATRLLAEVEGIARTYGVTVITTEVSLTARSFFEKKGYKVIKEQKCQANRLRLTNFVMKKFL